MGRLLPKPFSSAFLKANDLPTPWLLAVHDAETPSWIRFEFSIARSTDGCGQEDSILPNNRRRIGQPFHPDAPHHIAPPTDVPRHWQLPLSNPAATRSAERRPV